MHKYLIESMKYSEVGVPTNDYFYEYADTPQDAVDTYNRYNKMYYTRVNEEYGIEKEFKMFKVTLKQGVYKPITDVNAFIAINAVECHADIL